MTTERVPYRPAEILEVLERHLAAEAYGVARNRLEVDGGEFGDSHFEVVEARAQELLTLFRHRPFGIFRQIAMRACALEFFGQIDGQLAFEHVHVLAQPFDYWELSHTQLVSL